MNFCIVWAKRGDDPLEERKEEATASLEEEERDIVRGRRHPSPWGEGGVRRPPQGGGGRLNFMHVVLFCSRGLFGLGV